MVVTIGENGTVIIANYYAKLSSERVDTFFALNDSGASTQYSIKGNDTDVNVVIDPTQNKYKGNNENEVIDASNNIVGVKEINILDNIAFHINYITLYIFNFSIIINLYTQIKSHKFNFYNFKYSKISLKIKGIGTNNILGNDPVFGFNGMSYIKEIYINGNKQDSISKSYYFNQTYNFVELIFDDNIDNCEFLFFNCINIIEIDLSNFDSSQVTSMYDMFAICSSLTSLNLSNFNTSKVTTMNSMFACCSSLISLDLTNFDTSNVIDMTRLFWECYSLTSLDLSNFNTSKVNHMPSMFDSCTHLEYINLNNFDESNLLNYDQMLSNIPENVVLCISENITEKKFFQEIVNIKCHIIDCSNNWESKRKKIISNNNECIDNCDNDSQYKYENNGKCYDNCENGFLYDENNNKINKCKCKLDKCLLCSEIAVKNDLCTICNINYYPKENDPLNLGKYINCYNQPEEGYYLDNYYKLYKKCYHTCKSCNTGGNNLNHNCIECNENLPFIIIKNKNFNCYENCSYYYYFDEENNFHCTLNYSCPKEYPKLLENNTECFKYDNEDLINILLSDNERNLTKYYDNILNGIEKIFISDNYDTTNLDNGKDKIIETEKLIITFTTIQNQKNNINNNITKIDLGECEIKLRKFYNISINESLYIKKIDVNQDEMKTLKVEYDVYAKLFGNNLVKLNLSVCGKSKISISIPMIINGHLDKFNSSSGYYNDICYTTTSEDGTDILLKDRQKEFIERDYVVCQEDCDFSEYDYETFVAKCVCEAKESDESYADMNINQAKILDNFKNIKNLINFNFLICYKKLLCKKGILNNVGCYIILLIILFHIITIFVFSMKQFSILKNKIKKIVSLKEKEKDISNKITKKYQYNNKKNFLNNNSNKRLAKNKNIGRMSTINKNSSTKISKIKKIIIKKII